MVHWQDLVGAHTAPRLNVALAGLGVAKSVASGRRIPLDVLDVAWRSNWSVQRRASHQLRA